MENQDLTSVLRISMKDGDSGLRRSIGRKLFVGCRILVLKIL